MINKYKNVLGDLEMYEYDFNNEKIEFFYSIFDYDLREKINKDYFIIVDMKEFFDNANYILDEYNYYYHLDKESKEQKDLINYKIIEYDLKNNSEKELSKEEIINIYVNNGIDKEDVLTLFNKIIEEIINNSINYIQIRENECFD